MTEYLRDYQSTANIRDCFVNNNYFILLQL